MQRGEAEVSILIITVIVRELTTERRRGSDIPDRQQYVFAICRQKGTLGNATESGMCPGQGVTSPGGLKGQ